MSPGMGEFGPGSSPVPDDEDVANQISAAETAAATDKSDAITHNMTSAGQGLQRCI